MSRKTKFIYAFILSALCLPGLSFAADFECMNFLPPFMDGSSTATSVGGNATACGQFDDAVQTGAGTTGRATSFGDDNSGGIGVGGAFADDGAAFAGGILNLADSTDGASAGRGNAAAVGIENMATANNGNASAHGYNNSATNSGTSGTSDIAAHGNSNIATVVNGDASAFGINNMADTTGTSPLGDAAAHGINNFALSDEGNATALGIENFADATSTPNGNAVAVGPLCQDRCRV